MKLIRLPLTALTLLSVATVIAQVALLGMLYARGNLSQAKVVEVIAISKDVDLESMWQKLEAASKPVEAEQVSFEEVLTARKHLSLDLDLREIAADKGLIDVRQLGILLEDERRQYDTLKQEFDQRIENVRLGAVDEGLKEVQRQLESVDAKLAKDQILRILGNADIPPDTSMNFVVTMFKNMPLDRKKKIMGEFKSAEDRQQRRFPRPARPQQTNELARANHQADVVDQRAPALRHQRTQQRQEIRQRMGGDEAVMDGKAGERADVALGVERLHGADVDHRGEIGAGEAGRNGGHDRCRPCLPVVVLPPGAGRSEAPVPRSGPSTASARGSSSCA